MDLTEPNITKPNTSKNFYVIFGNFGMFSDVEHLFGTFSDVGRGTFSDGAF